MYRLLKFFQKLIESGYYFIKLLPGIFTLNKFNGSHNVGMDIFANGPSLKEHLDSIEKNDKRNRNDIMVMNFFAMHESFQEFKPEHYCLVDPMFFIRTHRYEKVRELFEVLNQTVDWEMHLYIPRKRYEQFLAFSSLTNDNILIKKVNTNVFHGFNGLENLLYRKGIAMPHAVNVSIFAIYIALYLRYGEVNLFGVDHTFFDNLRVDEQNRLCIAESHFYGKETNYKLLLKNADDSPWTIVEYLDEKLRVFRGHMKLRNFADRLNSRVINHTKNSLIDCYEKSNS